MLAHPSSHRAASLVAALLALLAAATPAHAQTPDPLLAASPPREYGARTNANGVEHTAVGNEDVQSLFGTSVVDASAKASFFSGTLRARVSTSAFGGYGCEWWQAGCWWGGSAAASIWDQVTIGPSRFGGPVTWDFHIDGAGNKGNRLGNGQWAARAEFYYGTDPSRLASRVVNLATGDVSFTGSMDLGATPQTFYFFMSLVVSASNSAWADYGNTMRFSWSLPDGTTYTSASGAFVAPTFSPLPPTTAPEPATVLLLGAGLGALAVGARRRRAPAA